ncbi:AI-2E family transporter [Aliivibrio fischeri]|uniref:AI-2E family transporter n=2 Tax=Aliivibrio fischeri TaxID=668 RepID=A0A6N3YWG4_ALIFS|nr:AI-2E family transporter [Aliivibrio fischeri]ACH66898.1 hipothetical membrane protein [Aliivibrio fischeri MJ11]MBP3141523.1 AI-2E family transporter [Aliivibrio fischeri]MBP3157857.1 AI-2E family transporter [Aliivibrio fischeri]MCE7572508.1 AI-2E family transporter [Aliivibrio fischeri]MUI53553.1 AI-2E family transporter [Aliivibrio fischeri]
MKLENDFSNKAIDAFIKISAIAILVFWCFSILKPFMLLVVWGGIIATALYPIVTWGHNKFGISKGKVSAGLAFIGVVLLVIPLVALSTGLYTSGSELVAGYQNGTISIPKPSINVKEWPLIGDKAYAFGIHASSNLESVLLKYGEEVKAIVGKLASIVGSLGGGFIQFIISTIIAGAFMANADKCERAFVLVANRLTGEHGEALTTLSKTTVRSVVQGVIGVAVIQSVMAGLGMAFVGVPAIGLWMLLVMLIAIIQLPPILALLPVILYVFSVDTTTTAVLFLIWCIVVSGSDAILKPMLLSRGSETPMLVILLGALGGMAMSGIVGLFVGAVILSLTYQLFMVWLDNESAGK